MIKEDYDQWAATYDEQVNLTRDLEGLTIKELLDDKSSQRTLELGCGTGKNTMFLAALSKELLCVDISENMLQKAKEKVQNNHVSFKVADITGEWDFTEGKYDLITCSLILEHISDLHHIFKQADASLNNNGWFYIGELHPFKQYTGSKARFETISGTKVLQCHTHHFSDYINTALKNGFLIEKITERPEENNYNNVPRILAILFKKK